ncbi:MAG: purine-nucleoside phosphorylase [Clostridium sp.]|jgi:purine-nucleoside phosphorylase|nr:purine-nucleoside phosphorylase [Clostridium sp.]
MSQAYDLVQSCVSFIQQSVSRRPLVALVLGSGLGAFTDHIQVEKEIPYDTIPGFPTSTVEGHDGRFIFGCCDGVPVVCMKGRVHYYEGYSMEDVVLPIRVMALLGAHTLLLTNAAGGINPSFSAGDLMLIQDQVSCFVPNPLIGIHDDRFGTHFPDMTDIYDKTLQDYARNAAKFLDFPLREGVYVQLQGPSYESPAEIRLLHTLGCDAVGMSTAVEAIAARHMGLTVCGISCVSNMAAGIHDQPLSHEDVIASSNKAAANFTALLRELIHSIRTHAT